MPAKAKTTTPKEEKRTTFTVQEVINSIDNEEMKKAITNYIGQMQQSLQELQGELFYYQKFEEKMLARLAMMGQQPIPQNAKPNKKTPEKKK
jgi:hypothetical protein